MTIRRPGTIRLGAALAVAAALLARSAPAGAWHGWADAPPFMMGPPWGAPVLVAFAPPWWVPPGHRLFHPPGLPLTLGGPAGGTTYCLSQTTGYYYVCAYAAPAPIPSPPDANAPPGDGALPAPSGVLLFRLPRGAAASVDGEAIDVSGGIAAVAVPPGPHRLVVRIGGARTEHALSVAPRAILTITPDGVSASEG